MRHFETDLEPKQERAVLALIAEPTVEKAAELAGISDATLFRWMREPAFREAYLAARRVAVEGAVSILSHSAVEAAMVMCQVMRNERAPIASRLAAARSVLTAAFKGVELLELEARIQALEEDGAGGRRGERASGRWTQAEKPEEDDGGLRELIRAIDGDEADGVAEEAEE